MGVNAAESASAADKLRRRPAFVRFWLASTVSDFGTYVTTVALSVLILVTMEGTPLDQGIANAARWAPYLVFGLLAGVWIDRFPRRTVMVGADLGRALILAVICSAAILGPLSLPVLAVLLFAFGALALTGDAAYQSYLPQLVPRPLLVRANARLQQSDTVAQTAGGAVAGGLVALISAPFALLLDAASYLLSAAVLLTPGHFPGQSAETPGAAGPNPELKLREKIGEGLRWVYGHPQLAPLAWSTHLWFVGFSALGAVLPALVLHNLHAGPAGLGVVLACAGVGAVLGTMLSARLGDRWGTGRAVTGARLLQPFAVALLALAAMGAPGHQGLDGLGAWPAAAGAMALVCSGQLVLGLGMGIEGPLEMGYRQAVTPDRLLGRMSATLRSINRGMIVLGAPLGGYLATAWGVGPALWCSGGVLLLAGLGLLASRFWSARIEDQQQVEA
ncbi:MFS transporter [Arthrobacter gengyunqii]|uniref:MFS transporter n=1 Tax=Arthrobacter gengyunqii TaxID=2886940 RepID=A0ABS8GHX3_9MICC|nr:MFS transporter [Arthrobacter gengyunqii]MCC3265978.1 MFS transporter [Arthrobacter gengyunqii]